MEKPGTLSIRLILKDKVSRKSGTLSMRPVLKDRVSGKSETLSIRITFTIPYSKKPVYVHSLDWQITLQAHFALQ
jgi:hypothetical protein